jgi:hypothetical protein
MFGRNTPRSSVFRGMFLGLIVSGESKQGNPKAGVGTENTQREPGAVICDRKFLFVAIRLSPKLRRSRAVELHHT